MVGSCMQEGAMDDNEHEMKEFDDYEHEINEYDANDYTSYVIFE